jgi:hypothetical protein
MLMPELSTHYLLLCLVAPMVLRISHVVRVDANFLSLTTNSKGRIRSPILANVWLYTTLARPRTGYLYEKARHRTVIEKNIS